MTQRQDEATRALVQRIKQLRVARGWSGTKLAEAMTAAGVEWNRTIVTNLETGRREYVSVTELLAFAVVFDTTPGRLLAPAGQSEPLTAAEREIDADVFDKLASAVREAVRRGHPLYGVLDYLEAVGRVALYE